MSPSPLCQGAAGSGYGQGGLTCGYGVCDVDLVGLRVGFGKHSSFRSFAKQILRVLQREVQHGVRGAKP